MPTALQIPLRLQAATPSLGVRLWIARDAKDQVDMVGLQVASEGGRGTALATVLVPVDVDPAGRVQPAMDLSDFLAPNARENNQPLNLLWRDDPPMLPTPFPLRWFGDQWRLITARTPWVLVLYLYPNARVAQDTTPTPADGVAALRAFFKGLEDQRPDDRTAAWIRRGLVRLAPADVPPSRPVDETAPAKGAVSALAQGAAPVPAQADLAFTFALASCQYPAGLVDGTPQDYAGADGPAMPPGPADASMLRLAARLDKKPKKAKLDDVDDVDDVDDMDEADDCHRPSLLVLTGDQIYADATAGLFDPRAGRVPAPRSSVRDAEDWLRVPYQNWYGSVGTQAVLGRLLTLMMLDDHEIDDNWEPLATAAPSGAAERLTRLKDAGSQGYQRYQRDLRDARLLNHLWCRRQHRGIPFFMADTRTERGARQAASKACVPRILGAPQMQRLLTWIDGDLDLPDNLPDNRPAPSPAPAPAPAPAPDEPAMAAARQRPGFIVSPSMLLPRRRSSQRSDWRSDERSHPRRLGAALHSDAWDGYPGSLHQLLVHLWKIGRSNLVFLSGDEHLSCVVKATVTKEDVPDRAVTLHSVHSSGLYSPYPFANSVPALFAVPDDWTFADPQSPNEFYRCVVEPCGLDAAGNPWAAGDGFALLTLTPPAAAAAAQLPAGAAAVAATAEPWQLDVAFDRAAPWADRCSQPPAPGVTTQACRLSLASGPGRL